MSRGLTPAQIATLTNRIVRPASFVYVATPTPIYAWDGRDTITIGGQTWLGVGSYGFVSGIGSERSISQQQISLGLNGIPTEAVPTDFFADTRSVRYQGSVLNIYMAFTDLDTDIPLSDPWLMWSGLSDVLQYKIGKSVTIALSGEHLSSHLRRFNGLRASYQSAVGRTGDQSDIFFRFLNRLVSQTKALA